MTFCSRCGRQGHWASICKEHVNRYGKSLIYSYSREDSEEDDSEDDCDTCFRCGRQGHWSNQCYAKKDKYGNWIKR